MVNFTFTFHLFLLEQAQTLHILQVFSDNPVLFRHHTALQPNQHYPYVETILIYLGKLTKLTDSSSDNSLISAFISFPFFLLLVACNGPSEHQVSNS